MPDQKRILIIGAYGFIGSGITEELLRAGHAVAGFGRSESTAQKVLPQIEWHYGDLREMQSAEAWRRVLKGFAHVVNAAGALQDGPDDDLEAVHVGAARALASACETQDVALVQISAAGVHNQASTAFFRTKAAGDEAIRASGAVYWILRPGLVLSQTSYGGSALLRMLASVPLFQPVALADSHVQCIHLRDLSRAVSACINGDIPKNLTADLLEDEPHELRDLIKTLRRWLGFKAAKFEVGTPKIIMRLVSYGADILGQLGWRSPLRSTAIATLEDGVRGDSFDWKEAGGTPIASLNSALANSPARAEDRIAARMSLLMPLCVSVLALFWALSGIIGLISLDAAAQVLIHVGWSAWIAKLSVCFWSVIDIVLAAGVLYRPFAKRACLGMIAVCAIYLISASLTVPLLWLDPLGPLVKVLPAMILSVVTLAMLETR